MVAAGEAGAERASARYAGQAAAIFFQRAAAGLVHRVRGWRPKYESLTLICRRIAKIDGEDRRAASRSVSEGRRTNIEIKGIIASVIPRPFKSQID